MFRNYFITAFRYIIRNKIQSFIQVVSLTIGVTAVILIGLYADHEKSYDKFNKKIDRIYRLEYGDFAGQPTAIGHQVKENFPEVENVVRIFRGTENPTRIKYSAEQGMAHEEKTELKVNYIYCDSTIFDVFTLPFIQGDPKTALRDPYSAVLTEHAAKAIFGSKDPVGEAVEIELTHPRNTSYTVTGVIKDVDKFHIDFDVLLSFVSISELDVLEPKPNGEKWLNAFHTAINNYTYLVLPDKRDKTGTENNINAFFKDKIKNELFYKEGSVFALRPLEDIYFSSPLNNETGYCMHGNLKLMRILLSIAVFILVLAGINYINLTTARASLRAREVGVRKVVGSQKSRLIAQFLLESVLISLVSFLLAITLVQLVLPVFNKLAMTAVSLSTLFRPQTILLFIAGIVLLGIMAGIYPAFNLSSFQPVASLKGEQVTGVRSVLFRRVLLTLQFAISVILLIGVFSIIRQVRYMKSADTGFEKELIVNVHQKGMRKDFQKRQVFKENMLKNPNITEVAFGPVPGGNRQTFPKFIDYNGIKILPHWLQIDPDYLDLMGIRLLQGRNFSWDMPGDYIKSGGGSKMPLPRVLVNEAFVRKFDMESPVGEKYKMEGGDKDYLIIGVVEDFHYVSLHQKIEPYVYIWFSVLDGISIKISPNDIQGSKKYIKNVAESMFPDATFEYSFLDETYNQQYENDERFAKIISNFAMVAVLIACLGLFGLSTFMAARRTKEIGIRKIMGASVGTVFLLLAREFAIWVALSVVVACPVGWIIMNRWLESFAYRTNISWWIFVLSIVIAYAIAFFTVAWQSFKTARTNPVEALRYE